MAVKKINASACESLLFEIASMAQRTKEILQSEDFGDHGETVRKLEMLENTVCQLGWLADVALTNAFTMATRSSG